MVRRFALAVALSLTAFLALGACGGRNERMAPLGPTTTTPPATATPGADESPEVIHGVEVVPLQVGHEVEVPDGVALIVETGCFQCDGPATALVRVYRHASGELRTDTLFALGGMGLPPRLVVSSKEGTYTLEPYIHSFALNSDASEMVVSVCSRGDCAWLGPASPDAQTTLFRSLDGGVTWTQFGTLDGEHFIAAIAKNGILVRGPHDSVHHPGARYQLFPNGEAVEPPAQADESRPLALSSGELIWQTKDGLLLRSDGSEFLALGEDASLSYAERNIELDPSGERFALVWCMKRPGRPSSQCYLGVASLSGQLIEAFSVPHGANVGGWDNSESALGTVWFSAEELATTVRDRFGSNLPALFDLDAARMHPIPYPFLDPPFSHGRNRIRAVLPGPFARVVDTGDCLNVRAQPSTAAEVLDCAADSVLLRSTGETREIDGVAWLRVVTPADVEGWASTQYLEE